MHLKFSYLVIVGFLAYFATNSCSMVGHSNEAKVINMRINHFKQTGFGAFPQLVYLVQEANEVGGEQWNYFYDEIENFEYEPGYVYDILVKRQKVENPPQDASEFKYILQKVISKDKVGLDISFQIKLKWGGNNFVVGTSLKNYSIMQDFKIDCMELCEDLSTNLENEEEVTGTFIHGGNSVFNLISID